MRQHPGEYPDHGDSICLTVIWITPTYSLFFNTNVFLLEEYFMSLHSKADIPLHIYCSPFTSLLRYWGKVSFFKEDFQHKQKRIV